MRKGGNKREKGEGADMEKEDEGEAASNTQGGGGEKGETGEGTSVTVEADGEASSGVGAVGPPLPE